MAVLNNLIEACGGDREGLFAELWCRYAEHHDEEDDEGYPEGGSAAHSLMDGLPKEIRKQVGDLSRKLQDYELGVFNYDFGGEFPFYLVGMPSASFVIEDGYSESGIVNVFPLSEVVSWPPSDEELWRALAVYLENYGGTLPSWMQLAAPFNRNLERLRKVFATLPHYANDADGFSLEWEELDYDGTSEEPS